MHLQVAAAEDVTLEMLTSRVPEIEQLLKQQELGVHRVTIQRMESTAEGSSSFDRSSENSRERQLLGENHRQGQSEGGDQKRRSVRSQNADPTSATGRTPRVGVRA